MTVKPIPDGYTTITPCLTVPDIVAMLEYLQNAFGAKVTESTPGADGKPRHAEVLIGNAKVMLGQASEQWPARLGSLYLYVEDTDAWYTRAMAAGATSIMEPSNQFYGDRNAGVEDPQGNQWWIATHIEDVSAEELERRMKLL
jgi:PhnB protein